MTGKRRAANSLPAIGGAAGIGMNGLIRPSVEAGGLAIGADEAAAGAEGVAAGGGAGAGALAELGGVKEVDAAGGDAGVCASAPETRRGSPTSAPVNKVRSIMRQNPKP